MLVPRGVSAGIASLDVVYPAGNPEGGGPAGLAAHTDTMHAIIGADKATFS